MAAVEKPLTTTRIYKVNSEKLTTKEAKVKKQAAKKAISNTKDEELFYYKIETSKHVYSFKRRALKLIKIFANIASDDKTSGSSVETAVVLRTINIADEYKLNTVDIINFVNRYIQLWSDEPHMSNYIDDTVQTSNAGQIIKINDLNLIEEYLSDIPPQQTIESKKARINKLNILIKNTDAYLHIDCLTKKLQSYVACILWSCSLKDIHTGI